MTFNKLTDRIGGLPGFGSGVTGLVMAAAIGFGTGASAEEGSVRHPAFDSGQQAFFKNEIWPILESNCVKCHGGRNSRGQVKIKSEFQIISRRGIVLGGAHGPAFDTENPANSYLLEMISYSDEDYQMPPDGKLPEDQIALLTRWVEMGMPWDPETIDRMEHIEEEQVGNFPPGEITDAAREWWSNKPLSQPAIPEVSDGDWSANPIDAFIFSQLEDRDLQPNPPADRRKLIRRAYFNLIGLPPSPEAVERFVNDSSPDAWKNLIDELLNRPEYGEKWARHWLDVVRYAESNGFERDSNKDHIWRFRDYVIDSFNHDKPWDQFTLEQIAGDEIPEPTKDSLIATGYHRLMQWDDEPADRLQHVYDVLDDNVRTTSEGFMAMTLGCARCHEHKADPILQEDYYRFMAFFHGVTQMSKNNAIEMIPDPTAEVEVGKLRKANLEEQDAVSKRLARLETQAKRLFLEKDPAVRALLNPEPVAMPVLVPTSEKKTAHEWHFTTMKPAADWFEVSFRHEEKWKKAPAPFGQGRPGGVNHRTEWNGKDIWLRTSFHLAEIPAAVELRIFHDEDTEIFLNGQKIADFNGYITEYKTVLLSPEALQALQTGRNTLAVHCRQTGGGQLIDLGLSIVDRPVSISELINQRGLEIFPEKRVAAYKADVKRLEQLRNEKFEASIPAMIVQEKGGTPADLHVHIRGSAHAPGDKVEPGFPSIFGYDDPKIPVVSADAETSGRRLALAKWLTQPENPRTSRVLVNRIWQHHFGRGICPTPSDFGVLGLKPTHPELLDWLASEFVRRGWSIKELHRLIMTSRTYQMSSAPNHDNLNKDPVNDNFWRFDMRRLSAEEMRDSILSVIGRINLSKGGPSFYPILPDAVLATSSTKGGKWGNSSEDDLFRRSIYIKIKRSLQPPELFDFDFADTDAPCPVRFTTTVPTQALNSLNSQFINDRASDFAGRIVREVGPGTGRKQIVFAMEQALGRTPEKWEIEECLKLFNNLRKTGDIDDQNALERFCLLVLNLNEFIYLD